jgi:hypothetical protein
MTRKSTISALSKLEVHLVDKSDYQINSDELYFLPIPDEIINNLKWNDGDELKMSIKDGKIILVKNKV